MKIKSYWFQYQIRKHLKINRKLKYGDQQTIKNNLTNWGIHNLNSVIIFEDFSISKQSLYYEIFNIDRFLE